jgi:ATP-dependent Zn protease
MSQVFRKARAEAPCVLILEDLDSLINDSNRVIGSTNHYDRLDPAITKRPSRFDRKLFVPFQRSTRLDANSTQAYLTNLPTMNEFYTFNIGRRNLDTTRTFRSQTLSRIRLQTSHMISASRI